MVKRYTNAKPGPAGYPQRVEVEDPMPEQTEHDIAEAYLNEMEYLATTNDEVKPPTGDMNTILARTALTSDDEEDLVSKIHNSLKVEIKPLQVEAKKINNEVVKSIAFNEISLLVEYVSNPERGMRLRPDSRLVVTKNWIQSADRLEGVSNILNDLCGMVNTQVSF